MPTITLAAPRPPATGVANKAAPTVIGLGEAGSPFAAILDGAAPDMDPGTAAVVVPGSTPVATGRQPVAVCGIVLPSVPGTAVAVAASPVAAAAALAAGARTRSPTPEKAGAQTDDETASDPSDSDEPATPVLAFAMPSPAPIAVPVGERVPDGVKSSLPPAISVVATPVAAPLVAPPSHPTIAAAPMPMVPPVIVPPVAPSSAPIGRDMRWTSMSSPAPAEPMAAAPQPAPSQPAAPQPAPSQPAAPQPAPTQPAPTQPVAPPAAVGLPVVAPVLASLPPIAAGPALQVFGAAMSAVVHREKQAPALFDPSPAAPVAFAAAPVSVDGQASLDLRQERWPQAMVAHIERLRDAVDATATRIRVIPDALGPIDVAVRRDGDTVHVQFSADQAATRALLQDAQPKLAAIAEERGLRLGQTAVDGGAAGSTAQQRQPSSQPQRDATTSPTPRGAATSTEDTDAADTGRVA